MPDISSNELQFSSLTVPTLPLNMKSVKLSNGELYKDDFASTIIKGNLFSENFRGKGKG